LEIIEDRRNNGAIIVTSQIPVQGWYEITGWKEQILNTSGTIEEESCPN